MYIFLFCFLCDPLPYPNQPPEGLTAHNNCLGSPELDWLLLSVDTLIGTLGSQRAKTCYSISFSYWELTCSSAVGILAIFTVDCSLWLFDSFGVATSVEAIGRYYGNKYYTALEIDIAAFLAKRSPSERQSRVKPKSSNLWWNMNTRFNTICG